MRKITLLFVTLLYLFSLSSCNKSDEKEKQIISPSIMYMTFNEILEDTDVIALVEIKEAVREIDTVVPRTVFSAEVLETYENKINETSKKIEIAQFGTNSVQVRGFNRFSEGDRVLLFLTKTRPDEEKFEGVYVISGEDVGTFYKSKINDNLLERFATGTDLLEDIIDKEEMEKQRKQGRGDVPYLYKKDGLLKKVEELTKNVKYK
jgi:hypothetical protein